MHPRVDTVIIGAGFAGLAAAYRLIKEGIKPLVIEKCPFVGGMASSHSVDGFSIEKFYHHFFTHDSEVLGLVRELGNEDRLIWNETRMGYFADGRLYSFTTPVDLLRFGHVGFIDRLNFALFTLFAKASPNHDSLDGLSAREWLKRKIGSSAYVKIVAPLIKSKFGMHVNDISASFLKGRINARVRSRRGFLRKESLGYYMGGLEGLVSALCKGVTAGGGRIMLDTGVQEIAVNGEFDFTVKTTGGESIDCDHVLATTPLPVTGGLLRSYFKNRSAFSGFQYRGAVCLCAGIERKLSDYYWINIASEKIPFGVIVEHTNLVPSSFYNGNRIIYLSSYCDDNSPLFKMDDNGIYNLFIEGLKRVLPDFKKEEVVWWRVAREPYATPVFIKDFGKRLSELRGGLTGGLLLAGNITIYPRSRNVNNVISSGRSAAEEIISSHGAIRPAYKHRNTRKELTGRTQIMP